MRRKGMVNPSGMEAAFLKAREPFESIADTLTGFVPREWPEMEASGIWEVVEGVWNQNNDALGAFLGTEIEREFQSDLFLGSFLGINVELFNVPGIFEAFGLGHKGYPRGVWFAGSFDQDRAHLALRLAAIQASSLVAGLEPLFDFHYYSNLFLRGTSPMMLTDSLWENEDVDTVFFYAKEAGGFESDGRVWDAYRQNEAEKRKRALKLIEEIREPLSEDGENLTQTLAGTWKRWRRGSQFGWRGP